MTHELGPLPEPSIKGRLGSMNRRDYYTADQMRSYAAAEVALAVAAERDCRTCRHHTTATGGCVSVLRCVEGSGYQRAGVRRCWDEA